MNATTPTMSLRVPGTMKERLDRMAKTMRRSRSSLVLEALENHLNDIQSNQAICGTKGRFSDIMKFKGAGISVTGGSTVTEIDASIRDFRGNE